VRCHTALAVCLFQLTHLPPSLESKLIIASDILSCRKVVASILYVCILEHSSTDFMHLNRLNMTCMCWPYILFIHLFYRQFTLDVFSSARCSTVVAVTGWVVRLCVPETGICHWRIVSDCKPVVDNDCTCRCTSGTRQTPAVASSFILTIR